MQSDRCSVENISHLLDTGHRGSCLAPLPGLSAQVLCLGSFILISGSLVGIISRGAVPGDPLPLLSAHQGPTRFWGSPQFPTGTPGPVCGPGCMCLVLYVSPGHRQVCAPGDSIYTPTEGVIEGGVSRIQNALGSKQ